MYATTGIIQGNTVLIDDSLIKHYNGKKSDCYCFRR